MTVSREVIADQFIASLPFARALNMKVETVGPGVATVSMPYDAKLIGNPETGVLHGGVISALMDTSAGMSVVIHPDAGVATATLDLRIDYMRAATPGQAIIARAECYHVARSVAFIRATAWDDDRDRAVATASGAFTLAHAS